MDSTPAQENLNHRSSSLKVFHARRTPSRREIGMGTLNRRSISLRRKRLAYSQASTSSSNREPMLRGGSELPGTVQIPETSPALAVFHIWSMGVAIMTGGNLFSWNKGLDAGFSIFLLATVLTGTGYVAFAFCISEILSGLPFSGGAHGVIRCSIGFLPGYIIGCFQLSYLIVYASLVVTMLASLASVAFGLESTYQPLLWVVIYFLPCLAYIYGGLQFFFKSTNTLGLVCVFLLLVFVFGSVQNFAKHHPTTTEAATLELSFFVPALMSIFSIPNQFFVGFETCSLTCNIISSPKTNFPKGLIGCIFTQLVLSVSVVICCSLQERTNLLERDLFPLHAGFMRIFRCSYREASALSLPALCSTVCGFMLAYGKVLGSLAQSKLLPCTLGEKLNAIVGIRCIPIIIGSAISFSLCFVVDFIPQFHTILTNFCFIAANITYCAYCLTFVFLRKKYGCVRTSFRSSFGIPGALYAMAVFLFGIVAIVVYQQYSFISIIVLAFVLFCSLIFYFAVGKHIQQFSVEEQQSLFVIHVVNFNMKRRNAHKKRRSSISLKLYNFVTNSNKISVVPVVGQVMHKRRSASFSDGCRANEKINAAEQDKKLKRELVNCYAADSSSGMTCDGTLKTEKSPAILHSLKEIESIREKAKEAFCEESVDFIVQVKLYRAVAEKGVQECSPDSNALRFLHTAFYQIVKMFVAYRAPCEVNLSSCNKTNILQFADFDRFAALDPSERMTVFDEAVCEIEGILRNNLLCFPLNFSNAPREHKAKHWSLRCLAILKKMLHIK